VVGGMRVSGKTFERARKLRREMSLPEVVLWRALRRAQLMGLRFRRQHPIGPYIVDFYCPSARLALEVDGLAHDNVAEAGRDERRQAWLAKQRVKVLRIRASDVLKDERLEGVLLGIKDVASTPSGSLRSPPPPPSGGGAQLALGKGRA
jgi:very-short-patch-repair endonuclease